MGRKSRERMMLGRARAEHLAIPHVDASGQPAACWHGDTPVTDLPAIDAAESTLRSWLEPWLGAVAHGTTLGSQIRMTASLVVRDAAPYIAAAERDRIIALIETEESKLRRCGHAGPARAADTLSNIADLITGSTP